MKPKEEFSVSKYMETEDYRQKNEIIKNEINKHKVEIDRSVFIKSEKEKLELKKIKKNYKNIFSNSQVLFNEILSTFAKAKTPNWGSFKFNGLLINTL